MPHLLNDPNTCVLEAIEGLCLERHTVIRHLGTAEGFHIPNVIALREHLISKENVAVICGGGSGHEPMHGGFVAPGMLSAAVCGRVFASPPISHVRAAIDYLIANGAPSVLVAVKRYTGDIINFGAAVEASRRLYGDDRVAMSVIGDDVTFGADDDEARGIAGTVLWYRLVTAAANIKEESEAGNGDCKPSVMKRITSVQGLKAFADTVSRSIRSMGASLQSCSLPGSDAPNAVIPDGEIEMGLGIHGERGSKSFAFGKSVDAVVQRIVAQIMAPEGRAKDAGTVAAGGNDGQQSRLWLHASSPSPTPQSLLVFVNNLGSTSNLEMAVIMRSVIRCLYGGGRGGEGCGGAAAGEGADTFVISACGAGAICTSLDMHGVSITVMNLTHMSNALLTSAAAAAAEGSSSSASSSLYDASGFTAEGLKALMMTHTPSTNSLGLHAGPTAAEARAIFMGAGGSSGAGEAGAAVYSPNRVGGGGEGSPLFMADDGLAVKLALERATRLLIDNATQYNKFDAACGDGDTGTGIAGAATALLANDGELLGLLAAVITNSETTEKALAEAFVVVGNTVCDNMAGSMGALLSIFITAMAGGVGVGASSPSSTAASLLDRIRANPRILGNMLTSGAEAVRRVIGTVPGDRTFIDVTAAVADALLPSDASDVGAVDIRAVAEHAITVVEQTTEAVSAMRAKKGRARYLGGREVGSRDPGSEIVGDFIISLAKSISE